MIPNSTNKKRRVLVVDDEPSIRDMMRMVLVMDGYEVETAEDSNQGLAKINTGEFDLVILDYSMIGMKGDQLAELIKKRFPCLPIIMVSAHGEALREPGRPLTGVDLLVEKPFSLERWREGMANVFAIYEGKT